jgi:hypothetical protein
MIRAGLMTYSTSTILPDKLASVFTKPFNHSIFPAAQLLLAFCRRQFR